MDLSELKASARKVDNTLDDTATKMFPGPYSKDALDTLNGALEAALPLFGTPVPPQPRGVRVSPLQARAIMMILQAAEDAGVEGVTPPEEPIRDDDMLRLVAHEIEKAAGDPALKAHLEKPVGPEKPDTGEPEKPEEKPEGSKTIREAAPDDFMKLLAERMKGGK